MWVRDRQPGGDTLTRATGLQRNFSFGGVITGDKVGDRSCAFTILVFPELQLYRVPLFLDSLPITSSEASLTQGKVSQNDASCRAITQKEDILVLQKLEIIFCLKV